ncbi:MAG TPA: STAS domain-containing protein [Streptosporangiaceae bacterium]
MDHDSTRVRLFTRLLPGHTVLAICGEVDFASTPRLRDQIAIALRNPTVPVIIDLSAVSFCDASGLALLVGVQRRARLYGLPVVLVGPRRNVDKLLRITGLDQTFTIYPTLAAAERGRGHSVRAAVA